MQDFARTADAIRATSKKSEKVRILADYFARHPSDEAATAALFFSGMVFPAWSGQTMQVGAALLGRVASEIVQGGEAALGSGYRKHGDLGSAAEELWPEHGASTLTLAEVRDELLQIAAARGISAKSFLLRALFDRLSGGEAKYILKLLTGDLRIGLKEALVEEAIEKAFAAPSGAVSRANMLLGDIGETLRLAAEKRLDEAKMRLFHPLGFMLASPAESPEAAFAYFSAAQVEDKYDGVRAQSHVGWLDGRAQVRIFSRTRDNITESFPELRAPLVRLLVGADTENPGLILDGEIVAWDFSSGKALPFSSIQKRLGRKNVSAETVRDLPVALVVFDVLFADGELTIARTLAERGETLNHVFSRAAQDLATAAELKDFDEERQASFSFDPKPASSARPGPKILRAPIYKATSADELSSVFDEARKRGNEGLMVKDLASQYLPGRRGRSWLKLKRELATLDVVVTAVEWGSGKRARVLSDYTFAVRDQDGKLVNIGKAYSGLTDTEIASLTEWFLAHTLEDDGHLRRVEPAIVLEVAFNNVMRSNRHDSGFALRFPRIVRIRTDKPPEQIDSVATVEQLFNTQHAPAQ